MEKTALVSLPTDVSAAPSVSEAGDHATPLPATEQALLYRVAVQDQHAFAVLYARYAAGVRRYLSRCLGQSDLVDDVLQEVMLVLWQRPSACPPTVPLIAWLCGIARHKARKAVMRTSAPPALPPPHPDSDVEDPARVVLRQEAGRILERALDALPVSERTVLVLLVQHGYSSREIATVMGTPVSTVRTRVWRACHRLRAHLAAGEAAPPRAQPLHVSVGRARRRVSQSLPQWR